jgi:K+-transporting ATPase ATPase C chain
MKALLKEIRISLIATFSLAVILCGIYPFSVWVIAQGMFPSKANGSLIIEEGKAIGSRLISQGFADTKYFHPRPSAAGKGYDALRSGGSNLGPI